MHAPKRVAGISISQIMNKKLTLLIFIVKLGKSSKNAGFSDNFQVIKYCQIYPIRKVSLITSQKGFQAQLQQKYIVKIWN